MPKHRTLPATGTGEDSYDLDHYCRTVRGDDADYRTKTRGGDSVGHRGKEVATPTQLESEQDTWQLNPTYGWIER